MGGRRRLRDDVPRASGDHRRAPWPGYRRYVVDVRRRLPGLPASATPVLREAALIATVELPRLAVEADALRDRPKKRRELRRLRRDRGVLRAHLVLLERRLEELAARNSRGSSSLAEYLERRRASGAAGGTP